MALKLNERYPGRFQNPSAGYPQGAFKNRTAPNAFDGSYLEQDWANDKEGLFQSLLSAASVEANGSVDAVGSSQYFDALLALIQQNSTPDWLNTQRIDVPSASNVNLGTVAPNTRNINITGSSTINGFTVAAGRLYFVRFNFALTLVNSASLITQTGSNLIVAAGDTCIIRAISANTVEIVCYSSPLAASIGVGQAWSDVTVLRALNTTYQNTTGRPIMMMYTGLGSAAGNTLGRSFIGGSEVARFSMGPTEAFCYTTIIPAGFTYSITQSAGSLQSWWELR